MRLVELLHLLEWIGEADVCVNDKDLRWVASEDCVSEVVQSARRAERGVFAQVSEACMNSDTRRTVFAESTLRTYRIARFGKSRDASRMNGAMTASS